jgi:Ca2+-binding EF-hand superfamily protein
LAKEEEVKAASKQLRAKLIHKSQGTKDEYLLGKLFEEFELTQNYSIGVSSFDMMLKKLNMGVAPKILESLFSKIDANKSEFIEFD